MVDFYGYKVYSVKTDVLTIVRLDRKTEPDNTLNSLVVFTVDAVVDRHLTMRDLSSDILLGSSHHLTSVITLSVPRTHYDLELKRKIVPVYLT